MDSSSWEFFCDLVPVNKCLLVLTMRQSIVDYPTCQDCATFLKDPAVKILELNELDQEYMAPLACQMMNVTSIPYELDE